MHTPEPEPIYTVPTASRLLETAGTFVIGERVHEFVDADQVRKALREVIDAYESERRRPGAKHTYAPVERTLQEEVAWTQKERDQLRAERDRLVVERNAWKREWGREAARREEETAELRQRIAELAHELAATQQVNRTLGKLVLAHMPAEGGEG
jgi:seryl-tRNA synthetase